MNPKQYATPGAFRRALEDRLLQLQRKERQDLQRLRRQVAFDRLLVASIRDTFKRRKTHPVPTALSTPPPAWSNSFAEMAKECGIPEGIAPHFAAVQTFLQPILAVAIHAP